MAVKFIKTETIKKRYGGKDFVVRRRVTTGTDKKTSVSPADQKAYIAQLRKAKCEGLGLPSPSMVKAVREDFGLSQRELARIVGGGVRSIQKYESGYASPSVAMSNLLKLLNLDPKLIDVLRDAEWVKE